MRHSYDAVPVQDIVTGITYEIRRNPINDTTDFTAFGAANNLIGTNFTATKNGAANDGGGVVMQLVDYSGLGFERTNEGSEAKINQVQAANYRDE